MQSSSVTELLALILGLERGNWRVESQPLASRQAKNPQTSNLKPQRWRRGVEIAKPENRTRERATTHPGIDRLGAGGDGQSLEVRCWYLLRAGGGFSCRYAGCEVVVPSDYSKC